VSVKILDIEKNSPAHKSKISAGETLISINGNEIFDVLDFRFYQIDKKLTLKIMSQDGKIREVKIKKGEYDEIGLVFETYLMDKQHSCKNKCIFCFVDQLPKGMRQSLYFKDDDSRLSFLFGNYVTLTNITEREIERIIRMHISPINVSVHTTNPDLRVKMMANPRAADVLSILKRFSDAGISINCQLVLCPEINDGKELERSLRDLSSLAPSLESIALVPVGLTAHREKLYPLKPYSKEMAREVIEIANKFGEEFLERFNTRLVYPSDEFFIKAKLPLPEVSYYEDFNQLDNGVGLIKNQEEQIDFCIEECEANEKSLKISVATGVDAAPFINEHLCKIKGVYKNLDFEVYPIINDFFGHSITVAGLVTAGDIIKQLKGKDLGSYLLIPDVMLRHEKDRFLDDLTVSDLENALKTDVICVKADGDGLFRAITTLIERED